MVCSILASIAQAQTMRGPVTSTTYTRQFLTNSSASQARAALGVGIDGTNSIAFNTTQFTAVNNEIALKSPLLITNLMVSNMFFSFGMNAEADYSEITGNSTMWFIPPDSTNGDYRVFVWPDFGRSGGAYLELGSSNSGAGIRFKGKTTTEEPTWFMTANDNAGELLLYRNATATMSAYYPLRILGGNFTVQTNLIAANIAASVITNKGFSATKSVLVNDENGRLCQSTVTSNELLYLTGVTSGLQNQIDGRVAMDSGSVSNLTLHKKTVLFPGNSVTLTANDTIPCTNTFLAITGGSADVVLTSEPAIAYADATPGQILTLIGADQWGVTIPGRRSNLGKNYRVNLPLTASDDKIKLANGSTATFVYYSGYWNLLNVSTNSY